MNASESLDKLIAKMRVHVRKDRHGDLPMWWRLRLWRAMKERFGRWSSARRSCLGLRVCQDLLPEWECTDNVPAKYSWAAAATMSTQPKWECTAYVPARYLVMPRRMCELAGRFLRGEIAVMDFRAGRRGFLKLQDSWYYHADREELNEAIIFIYEAVEFVLHRAVDEDDESYDLQNLYEECDAKNEAVRPTEHYLAQPHFWDAHFVSSCVAANGAHWERGCDNEARRQFWLRWLDETLPCFLGSMKQARRHAKLH